MARREKIDKLRAIADKHNALIVEDAAESFGATYKGVQTGSFGTLSILSGNGNNILSRVSLFAQREQSDFSLHGCLKMVA